MLWTSFARIEEPSANFLGQPLAGPRRHLHPQNSQFPAENIVEFTSQMLAFRLQGFNEPSRQRLEFSYVVAQFSPWCAT